MKKILAFTLAETLIVMGIIGIVSALTLPNLNSSTGEKEKVAKVKKIYQNLDDAYNRAVAVYGPLDEWFVNDNSHTAQTTRFASRIQEFLKVSKDCGKQMTGCFADKYTELRDNYEIVIGYNNGDQNFVILADGTAIEMITALANNSYVSAGFWIDIDGRKGSNKLGKDLFLFEVSKDKGVIPDDMLGYNYDDENEGCFTKGYCTKWVVNFDNMDYLKADNTGKCPNGKVLDGTTNTTCK